MHSLRYTVRETQATQNSDYQTGSQTNSVISAVSILEELCRREFPHSTPMGVWVPFVPGSLPQVQVDMAELVGTLRKQKADLEELLRQAEEKITMLEDSEGTRH